MAYNLKDEEEVKEYLKNLHIEYQFGCYSEKNANACHLLGEYTEQIKKEFDKALHLYKTNCDIRNFARSCAKYGDFKLVGKQCEQNQLEGYRYLRKSCDLNDPQGCLHAGIASFSKTLKTGNEAEDREHIEAGVKMLENCCTANEAERACFLLSGIYLGGSDYVNKNYKKAFEYGMKSCQQGNPYACANISQMYDRGDGVEKDKLQAHQYKQLAEAYYTEMKKAQQFKFQLGIDQN